MSDMKCPVCGNGISQKCGNKYEWLCGSEGIDGKLGVQSWACCEIVKLRAEIDRLRACENDALKVVELLTKECARLQTMLGKCK